MGATNGHVLYVGTSDGLYVAEPGADGYHARQLGLRGLGDFRAPVLVDCNDPATLYAGTVRAGIFRSRDGGESWQEIGTGLLHKQVWSIAQHPRTGNLYVGTEPANVYVSEDQGDTWTDRPALEQLPTTRSWTGPIPPHVSRMKGLALTSAERPAIYGAIEEGWAVRSLDDGESWEQIDDVDHDGHSIVVVGDDERVVVVSTGKGMFRSEDRGAHWQPANAGLEQRSYTSTPLVSHPTRPGVLLSGVTAVGPGGWRRPEGGDAAIARSDDGGLSWQTSTAGLPQPCVAIPRGLAVPSDAPDLCFAGMNDGTLWMSEDSGASFEKLLDGLPPVMSVTARPV